MMLKLIEIDKRNDLLLENMKNHYSQPKEFVGRSICYLVNYNDKNYGSIVAGSCVRHLKQRDEFFDKIYNNKWWLENIINNIFFHIEPIEKKYPIRNFAQKVLSLFLITAKRDWEFKYGNDVLGFETLVELPRTGEIYLRSGFVNVGQTKGFTCKRIGGKGTDSWSGKRVWNTTDLRPKNILVKSC